MSEARTYYVYIMASASRVIYTGVTNDLQRRVWEHKTKQVPGFTKKYNVKRLVWLQHFERVEDAIAREKEIKGWLRKKKVALIEKSNATWKDLSWGWFDSEVLRCAQNDNLRKCHPKRPVEALSCEGEGTHNRFQGEISQ
jgi:putative endonuclease